ncbi:molybdate ABC transporter substrate-binding protein [Anaerocolumna sp. MB42-C2]|uniref:molybdate ABC transporter substrate-binding protein n=1 Tax=Anaerocolumna sp. MB42-C2 TaxID=3070997 RepID=UPI0027E15746|nr:molybdate ABC transporter substrate-binding protein [Anaerocolumna sp. MB42-C2]WMJ88363.1 molybdate ABC transporter substrate-binding protein [Anaerocolumna sp. MB42-C2]
MKKGKYLLLLIICLTVLLTVGCTAKDTDAVSGSANSSTAEVVKDTAESSNEESNTDSNTAAREITDSTKDSGLNETKPVEILVAAAASLQNSMEEIGKIYQKENPGITVTYTFGSSGTLQEQIEQGAPVDVFMSAALKQMEALEQEGLILDGTKKELLENKVVLIVPKDSKLGITSFKDILKAPTIALGDAESVPVGQYAEEVFTSLNNLEDVKKQATYGKDVTEVLSWVGTGNADAGVVYATDAKSSDAVTVVAEAPEGSTSKVIYPAAVVKDTKAAETAKAFVEYLTTEEAQGVFEKYGFTPYK